MSDTKISEAAVEAALDVYYSGNPGHGPRALKNVMRRALAAAILHHPAQPAELAEQQGDREQFEARFRHYNLATKQDSMDCTVYADKWVQGAWVGWQAALAARQPVVKACTNCDRTDSQVICQTCAGVVWDNGRLHEFHETRELSTSFGEGPLDELVPEEWHDKPLLRFQGAYDCGDDSVGAPARSGHVLSTDQAGTVLGDYLATRKSDGADALYEADGAWEMRDKGFMWTGDRWATDWREL